MIKVKQIKRNFANNTSFIVISLFIILIFTPRIIGLGFDTYGFDSNFWDQRSDKFVEFLLQGNFDKTYRSYHPGVTVMYLSGFSKYLFQHLVLWKYGYTIRLTEGVVYSKWFFVNHFFSLLPLQIVITLALTAGLFLLYKLKIPTKLLIIFAFLLGIEPFFLGISRFLHVTALETVFTYLFVLFCFYAGKNPKNKKLWYISGIIIGLGFLSKVSAIIYAPFGVLVFLYPLLSLRKKPKLLKNEFILRLKAICIIALVAAATVFILWPSMWVNHVGTFQKMFVSGIEDDALNATPAPSILNNRFTYYPEMFVMRSTALTLISFLISIFLTFKEKNKNLKQLLLLNLAYVFYYFFIMAFPDKKLDRYINNVFPSALFVCAYTYYKSAVLLKQKYSKVAAYVFLSLITLYYLTNFYVYYPNFSVIHSDIFGGLSGYSKIAKVKNRGEFYLNAVMYLNNKDKKLGKDAALKILVVPNGGKDKSAQGYLGKIYTDDKQIKNAKADYYLPDYKDKDEEIPTNRECKLIQTFGPRFPLKFDYLFLYECK